jgi:hypothetical protein
MAFWCIGSKAMTTPDMPLLGAYQPFSPSFLIVMNIGTLCTTTRYNTKLGVPPRCVALGRSPRDPDRELGVLAASSWIQGPQGSVQITITMHSGISRSCGSSESPERLHDMTGSHWNCVDLMISCCILIGEKTVTIRARSPMTHCCQSVNPSTTRYYTCKQSVRICKCSRQEFIISIEGSFSLLCCSS